ncbi:hypothetical protein GUITHDRAFT_119100 [Guillardia theta CCMP2712]|uniref:Uncharacterized protein n=1 Tax=Guillardia theta (strain CCMP2712) TaxID=905079 RepID=L1IFX4_GUITC|nr:hypothetical protein GUITHDRAFT_119100 [Guillardia theta CCMP2712]EKX34789.1 hypothetical protein GUITHDRAFT_119100 [Guillardia theta CCMP2712]|eukprot:XP_005821769.1 hypothetical protein GUITHDRAFT_119100 [Guillardia theta CCMP2712]
MAYATTVERKNKRDKFASQVSATYDVEKIEKKKKSIKKFVKLSDLPTEEQDRIINSIPNMTNAEILAYSFPNPKKKARQQQRNRRSSMMKKQQRRERRQKIKDLRARE